MAAGPVERCAAESKRRVAASARGPGVGRRLLVELEEHARRRGAHLVRLETNKTLGEAIPSTVPAARRRSPPSTTSPYAHHWFERRLDDVNSGLPQHGRLAETRPKG
ncbi:GNAT family N-acetyltransferase [Streptomyces sp. NPDC000880]